MDVFNFIWICLLKESKMCGTLLQKMDCIVADYDMNFDSAGNRLAFMYSLGTLTILFIEKCIMTAKNECAAVQRIIEDLSQKENLEICSLSKGPGVDIIGLIYTLSKCDKPLKASCSLTMITKYVAWKNLLKLMTIGDGSQDITYKIINAPPRSLKFIHWDILDSISEEVKSCLKNSDIVLMVQSFAATTTTNKKFSRILQRILTMLKPGALLLFVDSKAKSRKFVKVNNCGYFLFGPTEIELKDIPVDKKICELVGTEPVRTGAACFSLWQKSTSCNTALSNSDDEILNVTNENVSCISDGSNEKSIKNRILNNTSSEPSVSSNNSTTLSFEQPELLSNETLATLKKESVMSDSKTSIRNENTVTSLVTQCENLISRLEELVENISQYFHQSEICECGAPKHQVPGNFKNCYNYINYQQPCCHACCCTRNSCIPKQIPSNCELNSFQYKNNANGNAMLPCNCRNNNTVYPNGPYIILPSPNKTLIDDLSSVKESNPTNINSSQ